MADLCVNQTQSMFAGFDFASHDYPSEYKPLVISTSDIVKIVFYALVLVGSLVGNIGVIVIAATNAQLRSAINAYLVNLAVADIGIVLFCMWVHLVMHLTRPVFILGAFWCKCNGFAQMTSLTASVLTLTAIACDRFSAVLFPLWTRRVRGVHRSSVVIALIWCVSVVVALPLVLYRDLVTIQWKNMLVATCYATWPVTWQYDVTSEKCIRSHKPMIAYHTMMTLVLLFAPLAIMSVTYALIVWRLWVSPMPNFGGASPVHSQHNAKKKVLKMVLIVLMVFVVCWAPLQVFILVIVYYKNILPDWIFEVEFLAHFLAYSNSLWNPVLYGGYNNAFRRSFCRLFRCHRPTVRLTAERHAPGTQHHPAASPAAAELDGTRQGGVRPVRLSRDTRAGVTGTRDPGRR